MRIDNGDEYAVSNHLILLHECNMLIPLLLYSVDGKFVLNQSTY